MIEAEKANYSIKRMCELLEVSRSGYYKWRANRDGGPTPAQRGRAELDAQVATFHAASDGVYGAPRTWPTCAPPVSGCPAKRWRLRCAARAWPGISPRRFAPATTVIDLDAAVAKDLVRHRFDTGVLNRVWTSDIKCRPSKYADSACDGAGQWQC